MPQSDRAGSRGARRAANRCGRKMVEPRLTISMSNWARDGCRDSVPTSILFASVAGILVASPWIEDLFPEKPCVIAKSPISLRLFG
ncbi:hypothetical protein RMSM_06417 [Rhodopirellula maiorica SM1]|uniref:Uncharacterized protein n=1 Tax=Rhodopirellula maiorica SM1 TaxID=1265738 RepID=M5RRQ7_9BACT|nr:hypothetical protein RMSM_06417 [Rhodopirellula maiorica SM1]